MRINTVATAVGATIMSTLPPTEMFLFPASRHNKLVTISKGHKEMKNSQTSWRGSDTTLNEFTTD